MNDADLHRCLVELAETDCDRPGRLLQVKRRIDRSRRRRSVTRVGIVTTAAAASVGGMLALRPSAPRPQLASPTTDATTGTTSPPLVSCRVLLDQPPANVDKKIAASPDGAAVQNATHIKAETTVVSVIDADHFTIDLSGASTATTVIITDSTGFSGDGVTAATRPTLTAGEAIAIGAAKNADGSLTADLIDTTPGTGPDTAPAASAGEKAGTATTSPSGDTPSVDAKTANDSAGATGDAPAPPVVGQRYKMVATITAINDSTITVTDAESSAALPIVLTTSGVTFMVDGTPCAADPLHVGDTIDVVYIRTATDPQTGEVIVLLPAPQK